MVALRFISSLIELTGALLMWRAGTVKGAFQINASLGLVGPIILLLVSSLGIAGLAAQVSPWKLALVIAGVMLIFAGVG
ncbi:MAG: YqhV family protein [Limnochordales bacterium]|nr:YqhV family protein [Limnochordales bacterium]